MNQVNRWQFAAFELDVAAGVLEKDGEAVRIGRQAFRALALLVSRSGVLVTREELQQEIWGDRVHVDFEHGLNVCIRQVRTALGPDIEGTQLIVTCPREGYRLGVAVTPLLPVKVVAPPWTDLRARWAGAAAILALVVGGSFVLASIISTSANPSPLAVSDSSGAAAS